MNCRNIGFTYSSCGSLMLSKYLEVSKSAADGRNNGLNYNMAESKDIRFSFVLGNNVQSLFFTLLLIFCARV